MNDADGKTSESAETLTGRLAEYQELLDLLTERPGLLVVASDPLSGASGLLSVATESLDGAFVKCDARACADAVDLAMTIADTAVEALAPDAVAWWTGSGPAASAAGLRLSRAAGGLDLQDLREGTGPGSRLLADSLDLLASLNADATLVIDHLGPMLSVLSDDDARTLLGALRAAHQRHPGLDLVLVEHSDGVMSRALGRSDHPMFHAGRALRIRRPSPSQFIADLAVIRAWTGARVELLGGAAELTSGVPELTWRVVELASDDAEVFSGWQRLRRATAVSTERQWDLLRRVHSQAQPVVAAMAAGLGPHSVTANAKSITDALHRLRGLGVIWQPERRHWSIADPLLRSWVREHPPPWVRRRRHLG